MSALVAYVCVGMFVQAIRGSIFNLNMANYTIHPSVVDKLVPASARSYDLYTGMGR